MRIDKYLKITRLIKRRTVAKELLDRGLFTINGKQAKASKEIKIGDVIELYLGKHKLTIKVLDISEHATKEKSLKLYEVIEDKYLEDEEKN